MEPTLEVLPVGSRGCWNRKWLDEVKAWVVAETLLPYEFKQQQEMRHEGV